MRNLQKFCLLLLSISLGNVADAQWRDLYIEDFFPVNRNRGEGEELRAEAIVFGDGQNISLHVEVSDPDVRLASSNISSDQVRVWLALSSEAFPEGFDYNLHAHYITARQTFSPMTERLRFFGVEEGHPPNVDMDQVLEESDYPSNLKLYADSNALPPKVELEENIVPFGMVGYAFFPDNRKPEWVNSQHMDLLEKSLDLKLARLEDSIKYVAEEKDGGGGYTLDISFSPASLGFVQLPEMRKIRVLIEVLKGSGGGRSTKVLLSSSADRQPDKPHTFNEVVFHTPLKTNFTAIPDELFYLTDFFPVFLFSEADWTPTSVDVGALEILPRQTSRFLTEIKFYKQMLDYDRRIFQGIPVETLRVQFNPVNQIPREKEFTLINNRLYTVEHSPYIISDPEAIMTGLFAYPDGGVGMILRNSVPVDPYGWDNCQTCVEERISVHRISAEGQGPLFEVRQGEGENAYCRIGEYYFPNFFLAEIDWIEEGRIMILNLNHRYLKTKRRIKVSWNDVGSDLEIKVMP